MTFICSFLCSFYKFLLTSYYLPGTALGFEDNMVRIINIGPTFIELTD